MKIEVKLKMVFSSEGQIISRKKNRVFVSLLGASYMQKESKIEFSGLAEEI